MLFLSLVLLAFDGICILLFLFYCYFDGNVVSGMLFPTIRFRLYIKAHHLLFYINNNLQKAIKQ
jgi:hypothetical protein